MGNQETKIKESFKDWEKVDNQNGVEIYRNAKNNEVAEKRTIQIDPHFDLDDQLKIYYMRQHNSDALVRAFGAKEVQKKGHSDGICSGHKKVDVLTQRIPYRLSQLPQLTFPQCLLFLKQSLRAYAKVFKSYGPIHVTKRLIGVNNFGEVKCWVNENWAINHADHDFPTLQSTVLEGVERMQGSERRSDMLNAKYRDQTEMVHNITSVIEEKCEEGSYPQAFREQIEENSGSFKRLQLYLEDFININQLFIPPKINYETVFVLKYETRLAQQHQYASQNADNAQQFNQSIQQTNQAIQQQQNQVFNQNYQQGKIFTAATNEPSNLGYTVTKTISSTYGTGVTGQNNVTTQAFYPSNQQTLWTKTQSIYKPAETVNQNFSTGTYLQYNKGLQSTSRTNQNFISTKTDGELSFRTDAYKPLPLMTENVNLGNRTYNYSTSSGYSSTVNRENVGGFASQGGYESTFVKPLSIEKTKTEYGEYSGSSGQKAPTSFDEYKRNFDMIATNKSTNKENATYTTSYQGLPLSSTMQDWSASYKNTFTNTPLTTIVEKPLSSQYTSYNTSYNATKPQPSNVQKSSTFSFSDKNDFGSKFGYSGSGYSNTLTKYETLTANNGTGGLQIDGKYAEQFRNLLGPGFGIGSGQNQGTEKYSSTVVVQKRTQGIPSQTSTGQSSGNDIMSGLMNMINAQSNQPPLSQKS